MESSTYARERLAGAVAEARNWTDPMRRLGLRASGGQRRVLREKGAAHGLSTSHFVQRSPWRAYPDAAIAVAAASSSSLREVALELGATPATGTLSHMRRRISAAGIDVSHSPGLKEPGPDLPFTPEELSAAAATATSIRGVARALGIPDDSRSRATLRRVPRDEGVETGHFSHRRITVPEDALRDAVKGSSSYADVMRRLGLDVNGTNHRRVRRAVARLGLDTSHFGRRSWARPERPVPEPVAPRVLVELPPHAGRTNRTQLHRALTEIGVPCACETCGNTGEWRGQSLTLQIDHVNGDRRDNRRENLRYLCPNCHALTKTWCRRKRKAPLTEATEVPVD
ncbi:HNH endonuclease signature motif containing protein [Streptomyces ziwulingensis]